MDVAWGFISDVDFDSEVFRWMGKARFTLTAVGKILDKDPYRARISLLKSDFVKQPCLPTFCTACSRNAAPQEKKKKKKKEQTQHHQRSEKGKEKGEEVSPRDSESHVIRIDSVDEHSLPPADTSSTSSSSSGLEENSQAINGHNDTNRTDDDNNSNESHGPPLHYIGARSDATEWTVMENDFSLFLVSNVRAISTDTFLTPYAHLSDGLLDVCFMGNCTRKQLTTVLLDNEKGDGAHLSVAGLSSFFFPLSLLSASFFSHTHSHTTRSLNLSLSLAELASTSYW